MKLSFGIFALIGSAAAFSPAGTPNRESPISVPMVADLYTASGVSTASDVATPFTVATPAPLARSVGAPAQVMPKGDLYDYDRYMNPGSLMPDAQRQTKPSCLPDIRDQQVSMGLFFVCDNACHSRGLSMTNRKKA